MAWIDDRIWAHPKLVDLSDGAFRAWVNGIAYSSGFGTKGALTNGQIRAIGARKKDQKELLETGLWDAAADGVQIHDWDDHNARRDARKETDRERKRAERERQAQSQKPELSTETSTGRSAGRSAGQSADSPQDAPVDAPQDSPQDGPQDSPQKKLRTLGRAPDDRVKEELKNLQTREGNEETARGPMPPAGLDDLEQIGAELEQRLSTTNGHQPTGPLEQLAAALGDADQNTTAVLAPLIAELPIDRVNHALHETIAKRDNGELHKSATAYFVGALQAEHRRANKDNGHDPPPA